ncbi:TKL protein kinase [Saprolegnia parasitica CBS 223.65]|uniref:TKL protein kinase n=1 Tax=Saprolegnia parasitica (strain CBS 223.65) TaxID=695850 RepID=A0A067BKK7_SAPPC|nr:TKL protein kinase [Saprolegnia parasitica CBS 223.65]KDO19014.1 TKL protein kinase [Saprolegnia parasitica CBS 223.65]|eukprot:XP_012210269.1 TKL protein kinase [Saprolegnia parasitica CBS 223.65]
MAATSLASRFARPTLPFKSPYVIELLDGSIDATTESVRLIFESMEGTLRGALDSNVLDECKKIQVAVDIARGLAYVHGQSLVHCNLKPGNVFVDHSGRAKLADFDLCCDPKHVRKTIGTAQYMAPELTAFESTNEASFPVDVYAFGVLLTELNTGDVPYSDGDYVSQFALWKDVQGGRRPALRDDCPAWYRDLAIACMAAEPNARPTVAEIIHRLERQLL